LADGGDECRMDANGFRAAGVHTQTPRQLHSFHVQVVQNFQVI
jgi:hypothetical protein